MAVATNSETQAIPQSTEKDDSLTASVKEFPTEAEPSSPSESKEGRLIDGLDIIISA